MIAYLSWEVIELELNKMILKTKGGVWYEVGISDITFANISLDQTKDFFIYHHITEGNQSLFGFLEKDEKDIFTELIKISWIGWKVAIQILSLWISRLSLAISDNDKKTIESIKWIWKKMAEKIILELKDKDFIKTCPQQNSSPHSISPKGREVEQQSDIISTLTNMWYSKQNIEKALSKISLDLKTMEEIIPAIIREI